MNYYPFHIGDYAVRTRHLSPLEDLALRRMLDLYYQTEHSLPPDPAQVARLISLPVEFLAIVESVLKEFFVATPRGFSNTRCEAELGRYRAQVEHGKKGARKRWRNRERSTPQDVGENRGPIATPLGDQCHPSSNQNQNQNQEMDGRMDTLGSALSQKENYLHRSSSEGQAGPATWDGWPPDIVSACANKLDAMKAANGPGRPAAARSGKGGYRG
jgi:uncharacterized protein YdaU (DUF1376 family)